MSTDTLERPQAAKVPAQPQQPARPLRLQVNRNGFWHDVANFDASDAAAEEFMRTGVELLCQLDARTSFRVNSPDSLISTLMTYSATTGWVIAQ